MSAERSTTGRVDGYAVVYMHDYGTDVWMCKTERAAKESVYLIILSWMQNDVGNGDDRRELIDLMKHDEYEEVVEKWQYETGETVTIHRVGPPKEPDQTRADFLAVLSHVESGLAEEENEARESLRDGEDNA